MLTTYCARVAIGYSVTPVEQDVAGPNRRFMSAKVRPRDPRPERVVFVFDGGLVEESAVERLDFPDGEIISASFHTLVEARAKLSPLLADRLDVAVQALEQGVTVLCEQGRRIA